ncbi:hypothetical protein HFN89_01950 [Rhizobium laguerreae]|nr:hypothetical protein [Rhizobium laguerreae]
MRIATRLPVAIPTLKGKPALCGVDAVVEIFDYDLSEAPTACVIEDSRSRLWTKAYRYADGHFLKMHRLGGFGEPPSAAAALATFAVEGVVNRGLMSKVRQDDGQEMLNQAYLDARDRTTGYEILYAAVLAMPSLKSLRKGNFDQAAAADSVRHAVSRASSFCRVNGVWHAECAEPAVVNLYSQYGVRRFAAEFTHPLEMPTGNDHWTMFPVTEYATAAAEPDHMAGWLPTNAVVEEITAPSIGRSPEIFGVDFLERETVRHLRCLPTAVYRETMTASGKPRQWVSAELLEAREALDAALAADTLLADPGSAVDVARSLVELMRPRFELGRWPALATFERTFARWDDRPVQVNEIVPRAPGAN